MARPRSLLLAAVLVALLSGAFVAALISSRQIEGGIPGGSPVLALAAIEPGFLAGTDGGLLVSPDGRSWSVPELPRGRSLVTAAGGAGVALVDGRLLRTEDLVTFQPVTGEQLAGTALAGLPEGSVYVWTGSRTVARAPAGGPVERLPLGDAAPPDVLALAVAPAGPAILYAGGIASGLHRSADSGASWTRLLATPVRAILIDPADPRRLLLGTPGGVLVSADGGLSWEFTELRSRIEGLAEHGGRFFAVTSDRLVFASPDGVRAWEALALERGAPSP